MNVEKAFWYSLGVSLAVYIRKHSEFMNATMMGVCGGVGLRLKRLHSSHALSISSSAQ
jgi:hypothetical protein